MSPKTRLRALLERLRVVRSAETDLITYAELMMPDPKDPDNAKKSLYRAAKHHRAIAAALEEVEKGNYKRLIITAPPRHGKTELISKLFMSWYCGRNPQNSVIFGTYNEKYATDIGRAVRAYIQHPVYNQIFPDVTLREGSEAADRLQTEQGGLLAFVGRGGTTTGRGGHLLVIDDPIKDRKEADSATIREDLWTWFTQVIKTRMMDKDARILIVQTRWHEDDLIGRLTDPTNDQYDPEEAKQWKIIDLPALAMETDALGRQVGDPLWPERFDEKFLLDQQRGDPRGFSALYQGRPTPPDGALIKSEYFRTYKPSDLPDNLRYYIASDHALSTKTNADKTCMIPVGIDENDNIYVLSNVVWGHYTADKAVEKMLELMRQYKPLVWWAEKTHISKSIGPFLRKRMREENVYCAIHEMTPLADKVARAQSLVGRMANHKVFFPERSVWWPAARDELLKFPNGQHDDFVDTMAWIGLGLLLQVGARPKKAVNVNDKGRMTFAKMMRESERQQRATRVAKAAGGW
jgi:predicted phage terminase large subunit-like protein